jgi:hypothetical protein
MARTVRGLVSAEDGSATMDECVFGCTGPDSGSGEVCIVADAGTGVELCADGPEGTSNALRRNAVLRRTPISESVFERCGGLMMMSDW